VELRVLVSNTVAKQLEAVLSEQHLGLRQMSTEVGEAL
jgi:hypothetical protein